MLDVKNKVYKHVSKLYVDVADFMMTPDKEDIKNIDMSIIKCIMTLGISSHQEFNDIVRKNLTEDSEYYITPGLERDHLIGSVINIINWWNDQGLSNYYFFMEKREVKKIGGYAPHEIDMTFERGEDLWYYKLYMHIFTMKEWNRLIAKYHNDDNDDEYFDIDNYSGRYDIDYDLFYEGNLYHEPEKFIDGTNLFNLYNNNLWNELIKTPIVLKESGETYRKKLREWIVKERK